MPNLRGAGSAQPDVVQSIRRPAPPQMGSGGGNINVAPPSSDALAANPNMGSGKASTADLMAARQTNRMAPGRMTSPIRGVGAPPPSPPAGGGGTPPPQMGSGGGNVVPPGAQKPPQRPPMFGGQTGGNPGGTGGI